MFFLLCLFSLNSLPADASSSTAPQLSASSGSLSNNYKEPSEAVSKWNPFEDTFTYEPTMEEDLFGAEFDKIRQEGEFWIFRSRLSLCWWITNQLTIPLNPIRNTIAGTIARHSDTRRPVFRDSIFGTSAACAEEKRQRWGWRKALHLGFLIRRIAIEFHWFSHHRTTNFLGHTTIFELKMTSSLRLVRNWKIGCELHDQKH